MVTKTRVALWVAATCAAMSCAVNDSTEVITPVDDDAATTPDDVTARDDVSSTRDAAFDAAAGPDARAPDDVSATVDAATRDRAAGCGARELCGNMLDDDCNGAVDDGCACAPGTTQRCYSGNSGDPGHGACAWGMQRCTGTGEFGLWGACEGEVLPTPEACDGVDNDCDGVVDEALTRACYPGAAGTMGVGPCRGGTQVCVRGAWDACSGAIAPSAESCDGVDNDCDGMTDNGCRTCITGATGMSPWQMHRVMGPVCFGRTFSEHGEAAEFNLATVPADTAAGWTAVMASTIDFSESSALCGRACTCLDGGEFTYFQTFFDVAAGFAVRSLTVTMERVDDGARVTVFNSAHPTGIVEPGSYVRLGGGGSTSDLARYIVAGRNRIVITHIDDCCSERYLTGVRLLLNGASLGACE